MLPAAMGDCLLDVAHGDLCRTRPIPSFLERGRSSVDAGAGVLCRGEEEKFWSEGVGGMNVWISGDAETEERDVRGWVFWVEVLPKGPSGVGATANRRRRMFCGGAARTAAANGIERRFRRG